MIGLVAIAFVAGSILTGTMAEAKKDKSEGNDNNPFKALWDAIAGLQTQIDTIELTPGPAGQGITFIKKTVPNQSCILQGAALVGWCPDGTKKLFIIRDSALVSAKAVILSLQQNNIANPPVCNIVLDGAGFAQMIIGCNPAPPNLALSKLVYIIQK